MAESLALSLFRVLVFPGFVFLGVAALVFEFADRKLYARFQHRAGPPWFQPFADFIKLASKEDLVPEDATHNFFRTAPLLALAAAVTSFFYIPMWQTRALYAFEGDAVVVLYLLTIPSLCFFLGGWFSSSVYSTLGAVRTLTALFAYEVPLFMAVLSPAIIAGTWSLSGIAAYYDAHPLYCLFNTLGFVVAMVAILGKLEKAPFDVPEAETEVVGGAFTEYSGQRLAFFRMTIDIEAVIAASLIAAVFLPFGLTLGPVLGFVLYLFKVGAIVVVLALVRSIMARLRLEQMVDFCWRYVAPAALVQLLISVVLNGVLPS